MGPGLPRLSASGHDPRSLGRTRGGSARLRCAQRPGDDGPRPARCATWPVPLCTVCAATPQRGGPRRHVRRRLVVECAPCVMQALLTCAVIGLAMQDTAALCTVSVVVDVCTCCRSVATAM